MPEGPSIVLLREEVARFAGRKIIATDGDGKFDSARLVGLKIRSFRSWGKHFLIELPGIAVRIHFLLFGSYTIDARKPRAPRLRLTLPDGEINFYSCAIRLVEGPLDAVYDWRADVMSEEWDPAAARRKLRAMPDVPVCDALLDQQVFSGVGNIIKNEVLFRIRVHPLSTVGALPAPKLQAMVREARRYSFEFLAWKRRNVLRRHWLVHRQKQCPDCGRKLTLAVLGSTRRNAFFCARCQVKYPAVAKRRKTAARSK